MRIVRMALPLLLVLASVVAAEAQLRGYNPANSAYERSQDVSMIQLIANPQAWDGKHIRVIGFLRLEFEGDALYLHKEDYVHGIATDAVWIDRPASLTSAQQNAINSDYVICEGIFRAGKHGHMGMFSGTISDINRLEAWSFTRPEK